MAVILTIAGQVISVLTAVAVTVASAVATAALAVGSALSFIGMTLYSVTSGLVIGVLEAIGFIGSATASNILTSIGAMNVISVQTYLTVGQAITAITSGFKAFLEAIHFHTLLQINDIAYIVSSDYREMMNGVYGELAKFSSAIGLGSQFITLAIRNARNVVLDVSSMLGRGYDLSEVAWLNDMNTFFTNINDMAQKIADDPYLLLSYIDEQLLKPSFDLKGNVVAGIYTTIDTMLAFADKTVTDISTLKTDLETLVNDLPSNIRNEILPQIQGVFDAFDGFIDSTYNPNFAKVSQVLDALGSRLDARSTDITNLINRLKKPGDIVENINLLPNYERDDQQRKLFTTVNRPLLDGVKASDEIFEPEVKTLDSIAKALDIVLPQTPYNVPEKEDLTKTPQGTKEASFTWFVGDF